MLDRVVDTRPVIEVGNDQPVMLNDLLREVTVHDRQGGLASAEIRIDNVAIHDGAGIDFAFEFSDTETVPLGSEIRILTPVRDADDGEVTPREIFAGRVSALEFSADEDGVPELTILAEDALMAWRMRRRTRHFDAGPARDVLAAIAEGTEITETLIDYLNDELVERHQVDETDLAFLRRVLKDLDADAQIVDGKLQIAPRADLNRGEVTLEYGATLKSVRISADLACQRASFSLSSYDQIQNERILKTMNQTALGPGEGRPGADYLGAFGDTSEHLSAARVSNAAEAQLKINAHGARAARRFVVAKGTAVGNPMIRVGCHLTLEGVSPRFANTYYVTEARHHFSRNSGYVTEFEAECAYFKGEVPQ